MNMETRYNVTVKYPENADDVVKKNLYERMVSILSETTKTIRDVDGLRWNAIAEVEVEAIEYALKYSGFRSLPVESKRVYVPICPICEGEVEAWVVGPHKVFAECQVCRRFTGDNFPTVDAALEEYFRMANSYLDYLDSKREVDYDDEYEAEDEYEEEEDE